MYNIKRIYYFIYIYYLYHIKKAIIFNIFKNQLFQSDYNIFSNSKAIYLKL